MMKFFTAESARASDLALNPRSFSCAIQARMVRVVIFPSEDVPRASPSYDWLLHKNHIEELSVESMDFIFINNWSLKCEIVPSIFEIMSSSINLI